MKKLGLKEHVYYILVYLFYVRTRFNLNPEQEWIQAHVAQTINL